MKNQISLKDKALLTVIYLRKNWIIIVFAFVVSAIIGFFIIRKVKPSYTATISFVLSTDQKNAGLSGLAAQLGFDGLTSTGENMFSGDNILELFKSRHLINEALMLTTDTLKKQKLLDLIGRKNWGNAYTSLEPFDKNYNTYTGQRLTIYKQILNMMSGSYAVFKKDKKLIFYVITASNTNPEVAYQIANCMLNETSNYFIDIKTKNSANSVKLLTIEADSLASVLGTSYTSVAATIDKTYNLNPSISVGRAGAMFTQSKSIAVSTAYAEVMRNLEIAKINLQKETPLFRIIDEPEFPLPPQSVNKLTHTLRAGAFGGTLMIILLSIANILKFRTIQNA